MKTLSKKLKSLLYMLLISLFFISGIINTSCNKPEQQVGPVLHRLFLVKYKPEVTQAQIDENVQAFYSLKEKVPGMVDVMFAQDANLNREKQFTHVMILSFNSEEAMKAYEEHPIHKGIAETGPAMLETFFMMDYRTGTENAKKESM